MQFALTATKNENNFDMVFAAKSCVPTNMAGKCTIWRLRLGTGLDCDVVDL
jgi:hypothetical protein